MRDLKNERAEVVSRLQSFNFEPVNAEALMPDGGRSWDVIKDEIGSSDLFILILGERYGWIPDSGPLSGLGKSVTELEYLEAQKARVPVLPFFLRLQYSSRPPSDDEILRDGFRERVSAWDEGHFRAEFELASDLAEAVTGSIISLLSNRFTRSGFAEARTHPVSDNEEVTPDEHRPSLPRDLLESVQSKQAVLFAGAGLSLSAGLPSAKLFADSLVYSLSAEDPSYRPPLSGTTFNASATDFEATHGREALLERARELIEPQALVGPSAPHKLAAELFDLIITTNYDGLIERSAVTTRAVIEGDLTDGNELPPNALVKLNGSIGGEAGERNLVLTEADLAKFSSTRPHLLSKLRGELTTRPLLAIGTSLRDPSVIAFLNSLDPGVRGWFVVPSMSETERARVRGLGLIPIEYDAEGLLLRLTEAMKSD